MPSTWSVPASGRSSVAIVRMNVVLPAPLGPSTASTDLDGRVKVETGERLDVAEPFREALGLQHQRHGRADYDTDWPTPIKLPSLSRNHAPRSREPFEG